MDRTKLILQELLYRIEVESLKQYNTRNASLELLH